MKQQKEKQTDVVFGIKKRAFLEKQFHSFRAVRALIHWWAFALLPAHQKHLIASLLQGQTRLVDPLVCNQVVDHRYDGAFHGGKDTNVFDETLYFHFYYVFLHP